MGLSETNYLRPLGKLRGIVVRSKNSSTVPPNTESKEVILGTAEAVQELDRSPGPSSSGCKQRDNGPSSRGSITVPDGGLRAWLVVVGAFLNFTTAFGVMNSFGTFQSFYKDEFLPDEETSTITWVGSVQLFLLYAGGAIIGPAFDQWGARRIIIPGAVICIMSHIATSFATKFWHLLLSQGFFFGVGNAMLFYPASGCISEWFDQRRGFALGLAVSGSSVGGIYWPLILGKLLDTVGFAWTNRILAATSTPFLVIACVLIQERKCSKGHDTHGQKTQPSQGSAWKTIAEWQFLTLSTAMFFIYMGMLIPFYYIPMYAQDKGLGDSVGNPLLAISYAGSFCGRIGTGWGADKIGRFNMLLAMAAVTGTLLFCWMVMQTLACQVLFALLFGFCSGGLIPLGSACVAQTTPDLGHIGLRIGAMMLISSIGTLIGGPLSASILGLKKDWAAMDGFAGGLVLLGCLILVIARSLSTPRWKLVV